ncbi:IS66 family transposase zinc-finger binding domain-containing protein [Azospirillum doebereinerae]|uniref:IS66 family transposase zinc-finger binding domain-containing protein n=1 Tax=Azospirillum doebereinerae TaxID=92933 RepID=UPI00384FC9ED
MSPTRPTRVAAPRRIFGENISQRLDPVPARFRVLVTRRPKYACRQCEEGVVHAPAPARLNGIDAQAWFADVLTKLVAGHPITKLDELLPQVYVRQTEPAVT